MVRNASSMCTSLFGLSNGTGETHILLCFICSRHDALILLGDDDVAKVKEKEDVDG